MDNTTSMHLKMHAVIYGQFQAQPGWRKDLEDEYMNENDMCYEDEDTSATGFVRVLISEQYSEVKRLITDRAKKSHGTFVRIRKQPRRRKKASAGGDNEKETESDANSSADHQGDTDDDTSTVSKPPKINKGIFHSSYIRVEKKITRGGRQQWVASPKSRVISSKEYEQFRRQQELNTALQAKLIKAMEQNIKLRDALMAHSVALPADLQETDLVDFKSQDDAHSSASDTDDQGRDDVMCKKTRTEHNNGEEENASSSESQRSPRRMRKTTKFAMKRASHMESEGAHKNERTKVTPRETRTKKKPQISTDDESSEDFSVGEDEEDSEDMGTQSTNDSAKSEKLRATRGGSSPRNTNKTQRKYATADAAQPQRSHPEICRRTINAAGQKHSASPLKTSRSLCTTKPKKTKSATPGKTTWSLATTTPKTTKSATPGKTRQQRSLRTSKKRESSNRCPTPESAATNDDPTRTAETEEEEFSPEPTPNDINDDDMNWSVTVGENQDALQEFFFSDSESSFLQNNEAARNQDKKAAGKNGSLKNKKATGSTGDQRLVDITPTTVQEKATSLNSKNDEMEGKSGMRTTPIDQLLELMATELDETQELIDNTDVMGKSVKERTADLRQGRRNQLKPSMAQPAEHQEDVNEEDTDGSTTESECDYEHGDYDLGTTYYAIEDPKELLFVLQDLTCKLCNIPFGKQQGEWKPGQKTPVYACHGMRCGDRTCTWAVCGNCFGKEQLKRVDEPTTMRTRRRN